MSHRNQLFLAKAETTPNTAVSLTGADVIPIELTAPQVTATAIARNVLSPLVPGSYLPDIMAEEQIAVPITTEVSGSGTPGTPSPILSLVLAMAGFNQTVATGVSVTNALPWPYSPTRYSIAFDHDGIRYGGRGSLVESITFSGEANGIMKAESSVKGIYMPVVSVAQVTPTLPALINPAIINSSGVETVTVAGVSCCLATYSCTVQNQITYVNDGGNCPASFKVTDRTVTGSMTIQRPALANLDLFEKTLKSEIFSIVLPYGTTAGNIITFNHPKVQGSVPQITDRNGLTYLSFDFTQKNPLLTDQFTIVQT